MTANVRAYGVLVLVLWSVGVEGQTSSPPGEQYRVEFEARRWKPMFDSHTRVGVDGTSISPMQDLGIEEQREIEFRGNVRLSGRVKIRATWVKFDYETSGPIARDIDFGNVSFPADAEVTTQWKLEHTRGGVEVEILRSRDGFLAVVADFSRLEVRPALSSPGVGEAIPDPFRVDLLTLGLRGRVYLTPAFLLTAEANGMRWNDRREVVTDVEGAATWNFGRNVGASFGYRNFYNKLDTEDVRATIRLRGTFFAFTARF